MYVLHKVLGFLKVLDFVETRVLKTYSLWVGHIKVSSDSEKYKISKWKTNRRHKFKPIIDKSTVQMVTKDYLLVKIFKLFKVVQKVH